MSPRLPLLLVLLAGCDEPDDRSAHPILLPPVEQPKNTRSNENVSPLTPIVLPREAVPPPPANLPPPPPERVEPKTLEAPVAALPVEEIAPPEQPLKPPPPKKKKKR